MRVEVCLTANELIPELTLWLVGAIVNQADSSRGDLPEVTRLPVDTPRSGSTTHELSSPLLVSPSEIPDDPGSNILTPGDCTVSDASLTCDAELNGWLKCVYSVQFFMVMALWWAYSLCAATGRSCSLSPSRPHT